MLPYTGTQRGYIKERDIIISSFLKQEDPNIDWSTVESFGDEWTKFDNFTAAEIELIGNDYFDIVTEEILNHNTIALDVGCGSGRWIKFVAPKVKFVEGIEPSLAVVPASKFLHSYRNVRLTQASVESIPFADCSFDFIYSLGVLHHVPDTQSAIQRCGEKLKPGGWFLLYLYYSLDNRSHFFRFVFTISNLFRGIISNLPRRLKRAICDVIAVLIYWPLANLSLIISLFSESFAKKIPLSYYRKTTFHVMRNDSLDRFGTPLEKRFSKEEIHEMLNGCGFRNIQFSNKEPYWHVLAQK